MTLKYEYFHYDSIQFFVLLNGFLDYIFVITCDNVMFALQSEGVLRVLFKMDAVKDTTADSSLSHDELLELTESSLSALLISDSLLKDLPDDITIEEIQSQIAVEHGQLITVYINRDDKKVIKIVIPQDATVRCLKNAIAKQFEHFQRRNGIKVKITWKYIWNTFNLHYDSIVLDNNDACIQEYGITNKVFLTFKKKKRQKMKNNMN